MPENNEEKKQLSAENDDDRIKMGDENKGSIFDVLSRRQAEKLEEESRQAEMLAEQERAEREAYSKKLAQDKIELMKLKAGIIDELEPTEKEPEKVYSIWEKIGNFFYHNKVYIIMITIVAALAIFLIVDVITNVKPDATVMIIVTDDEFVARTEDIRRLLEPYCKDYNDDGKISMRVAYLPAIADTSNTADAYYTQATQINLMAEFQGVDSIMVITDQYTSDTMKISDEVLADMREVYPDDEYAQKIGYQLKGTDFAEQIKYTSMADDLYMCFRSPKSGIGVNEEKFQTNYENALEIWDNYLNGNVVNEAALSKE